MAQTSGTYNFAPAISEFVADAFGRLQIFPPLMTIHHIATARFKMNLLLSDWAATRGINLAQVDQLNIPLVPGLPTYVLPNNTVDLLDVYIRTLSPSSTTVNLGNALTPLGPLGNPTIGTPFGDPVLATPGSNTLSCTAGDQMITLRWPAHGLSAGAPIFWGCPISIGGLSIAGFSSVNTVLDTDRLQFLAPIPARETQTNQGGTPLFSTNIGSSTIGVIQPGHGLSLGETYTVQISTTVGGVALLGDYTVTAIPSPYEFSFDGGVSAGATDSVFENDGQINVAQQAAGVLYTDVPMFPLSRNDYANLSVKLTPGRPTSFWLDRIVPPTFTIYPVVPVGSFYSVGAWRMREFQDALPIGGQNPELPRRMWNAFAAALTAELAETFAPAQWAAKVAAAQQAWDRAQSADTESVTTHIVPVLGGYYR